MKKITLLALFSLVSIIVFSQEKEKQNDEFRTIFGDTKFKVSGEMAFNMAFSSFDGDYAVQTGGSMGILLNRQLIIGGYGQGVSIDRVYELYDGINDFANVGVSHGGFWLGYIIMPDKAIHPTVSVQTGWGRAKIESDYSDYTDNIFAVNPMVDVELNITRFFKIGIGGHYTFVNGINTLEGVSNEEFSGPGGTLSFRFGWF